jgi:hypothetical protein
MKTLLLVVTALALVAAVNPSSAIAQRAKVSGFGYGTQNAQEVADQSGLRDILADLASGRSLSARVSLPLQTGFFNGQTALYITPEVGVDPSAGSSTIAAAQQVAAGFNANFIPQNFASLPGSGAVDDIFVFTNFSQGNVLASAPNPAGPRQHRYRLHATVASELGHLGQRTANCADLPRRHQHRSAERFRECSENAHYCRVFGDFHTPRWTVAIGNGQGRAR